MIERGKAVAFVQSEALGDRAGRDVAHDDLKGNDLQLADQLLAHVEAADEMRRNTDFAEAGEQIFGNPVVQHSFAFDALMPLAIQGGCVILEVLDQGAGLGSFIKDLRLSLIDLATAVHRDRTSLPVKMQNCRVAQNTRLVRIYGLEIGADKQATPWLSIGSCAFLRLNQAIVQRDTSGFAGMKQSFDGAAQDAARVASAGRGGLCHFQACERAEISVLSRPGQALSVEDCQG